MATSHPVTYGGEAVFDGVMMRGRSAWSLAVRQPSGEIAVEVHPLSPWMTAAKTVPVLRGILALATSVALGCKALVASMRYRSADAPPPAALERFLVALGVTLVLLVFLSVPVVIAMMLPGISANAWGLSTIEAVVRLVMVFGYIALLGTVREVQEVFRYHGAEHQAIAAREAGVVLEPAEVAMFNRAHPRCGTSFLLLIVVVGIVVHAFAGVHSTAVMAASRLVLLPAVLGCTYELIRFASFRMHTRLGHLVVAPGMALQKLTTRLPDDSHREVAIAALEAVVAADAQASVRLAVP